ncbi:MAG: hypothetical protein AAF548_06330 [Actinomycetota bacterium]
MTLTLIALAFAVSLNPFRAAAATPDDDRRGAVGLALVATLALVTAVGWLAGPILDAVGVTGASARIAAGIAMLAIALRDVVTAPSAEPALPGIRAGLVPLAFPVLFTPAVAMLAIAAADDRGVLAASAMALPGLVLVGIAAVVGLGRRSLVALGGGLAAVVAALVVLDGVYAI